MVPLFHCRTYIMTLSIGLLWLIGTFARAQSVERVGEDQVTVQAEGVALGALLREIAEVVPIEKLLIDPSGEQDGNGPQRRKEPGERRSGKGL